MADAPRGELLEAVENQTRVLEKQSRIMGKLTQAITHSFGATEALKSSLMKVDGESSKRIKGLMSTFEKIPVSMEKSIKGFGTLLNMGLRNLDKSFLRAAGQIQALDLNLGSFSTVLRFNSNILRLNGRGQADMIQELIKLRKTTGRSPEVIAEALGQLQPQVAKVAAFVGPDAAAGLQKALGATVGEFLGHEGAIAKMLDTFGGLTMESRGMRARIGLNPTGGIGQGNDLAEMGNILTAIHKMFASISDPAKAALLFEVMGMDHQMLLLAKTFIGAGGMASLRRAAGGGESSESTFSRALTKLSNATDALFKPLFNILTDSTLEFTKWLTTNMADLQPLVAGFANWAKDMIPLLFVSVIRALVWIGEGIGKLWNYFTARDESFDITQSQIGASKSQLTNQAGSLFGLGAQRTSFMADVAGAKAGALGMLGNAQSQAGSMQKGLGDWLTANVVTPYNAFTATLQELFKAGGLIGTEFDTHVRNLAGWGNTMVGNFGLMLSSFVLEFTDTFRQVLADFVVSMFPILDAMLPGNQSDAISSARHAVLGKDDSHELQRVMKNDITGKMVITAFESVLMSQKTQNEGVDAGPMHKSNLGGRIAHLQGKMDGTGGPVDKQVMEEMARHLSPGQMRQMIPGSYDPTMATWNQADDGESTKNLAELAEIAKETFEKKLVEEQFRQKFLETLDELKGYMATVAGRI